MIDRNTTMPRVTVGEASERLNHAAALGASAAGALVHTSTDRLRFHDPAPRRASNEDLQSLRRAIVDIAMRYGFPEDRVAVNDSGLSFDQSLAEVMSGILAISPAEASEQEVWSHLTSHIVPDVAVWRFPAAPDDPDRAHQRLLHPRRGLLRQAWWRNYYLGPFACTRLDEDAFVQLTDRKGVVGNTQLAQAVVLEHLQRLDESGYAKRATLREALKLIRRLLGRLHIEALDETALRSHIRDSFDQASRLTQTELTEDRPSSRVPHEDPIADFLRVVGAYGEYVSAYLSECTLEAANELASTARTHARAFGDPDGAAVRIAEDLSALVDQWDEFTAAERSVAHAALRYFLLEHDAIADHLEGGLVDDDWVTDAAYAALALDRTS